MVRSRHTQSTLSKLGFILGWIFFIVAFLAAALESVVGNGFITPAEDLLKSLSPAKWIIFKSRLDSVFFDTVILGLLQLPGWFIAGLPAGLLIWHCRPHREDVDPELYDSMTTFDRLAALAKEEGALDDDPTFVDFRPEDYDNDFDEALSAKAYMKNWQTFEEIIEDIREHNHEEASQGPEGNMEKARQNLPIPFDKLS